MFPMEAYKFWKNGEIRKENLELIGHWFVVDGVNYYMLISNL